MIREYLTALVRASLTGAEPPKPPEGLDWQALARLSVEHNVSALTADAVSRFMPDAPDDTAKRELWRGLMSAKYADAVQHFAVEELSTIMEERGIEHGFIKGVDIKGCYPAPYLREMMDVDVIVKPRYWQDACELLKELGYREDLRSELHSVYYRGDVKLELHRMLLSEHSPHIRYDSRLRRRLRLRAGSKYRYEMPVCDQYLFMLLHIEKHIVSSVFVLRFIVDIAVMRRLEGFNAWRAQLQPTFRELGIAKFVENLEKLADGWFSGAELTDEVKAVGELLWSWDERMGRAEFLYKREWNWLRNNRFPKKVLPRMFPSYTMLYASRPDVADKPYTLPAVYIRYQLKPYIKLYPYHKRVMSEVEPLVSEEFKENLPKSFALLYGRSIE